MADGPNPLLVGPCTPDQINEVIAWAIHRAEGEQPGAAFAQGVVVAISWLLGVSSWHPQEVCRMLESGMEARNIAAGLVAPGLRRGG